MDTGGCGEGAERVFGRARVRRGVCTRGWRIPHAGAAPVVMPWYTSRGIAREMSCRSPAPSIQ